MTKNLIVVYLIILSNILSAQDILKIPATKTKAAIDCPMEGNPKENNKVEFYKSKNRLKNRYVLPLDKDFDKTVTLNKMLGDSEPDINKFSEKNAGSIEGYIVYVSPSGWAETCNCGTTLSDYTDIHIEIAETPDEEKGGRTVVVELTPRIRLKNIYKWSRKELKELWVNKEKVKITGWLFYDKEHENRSRNIIGEECEAFSNRRQTCWEIHPIINIEVISNSYEKGFNENLENYNQQSSDNSNELDIANFEDGDGIDCLQNICDCKLLSNLIWPVTIVILILMFNKKIKYLLGGIGRRVKKIKVGNVEIELEELNKTIEKVEQTLTEKELKFKGLSGPNHPYEFDYEISKDLPTEILKISLDIEKTLRAIYQIALKTREKRPLSVSFLIETLYEKKLIDLEHMKLLRQFWIFRNNIVHSVTYSVTDKDLLAFADLGIRVLKILKILQNNISDGSVEIQLLD